MVDVHRAELQSAIVGARLRRQLALVSDVRHDDRDHGDDRSDDVDEAGDIRARDAGAPKREKRAPRKAAG
jgi:hypothetical protein